MLLALVLICMWYRNGFRMLLLLCILSANCRIHFRVTKSKWDYEPSYSGSESSVSPRHCISEKELWVISIPSLCIWNVVFSNETLTPQFLPLVKTISIHCVFSIRRLTNFIISNFVEEKKETNHYYHLYLYVSLLLLFLSSSSSVNWNRANKKTIDTSR